MLNKNTWGVKKCRANQKQHCKQAGATKRFDISCGQEVTTTLSNICNSLNGMIGFVTWLPSDKANHTFENIVCHSRSYKYLIQ